MGDVPEAVAFFVDGLGFRSMESEAGYVSLELSAVRLAIVDRSHLPAGHPLLAAPGERQGLGVEIVIEVRDVDAVYERICSRGIALASALGTRPWGLRDFRVMVPCGYYVRVTSR